MVSAGIRGPEREKETWVVSDISVEAYLYSTCLGGDKILYYLEKIVIVFCFFMFIANFLTRFSHVIYNLKTNSINFNYIAGLDQFKGYNM